MAILANSRQRVRVGSVVRIARYIEGKGTITVSPGQEIGLYDVIGRYQKSAGFTALKLANLLGVSHKSAPKFLQRKIGEKIYKGELLASKKGLFGVKNIPSPADAILEEYNLKTGELRLKYFSKQDSLISGVYGIVEDVDKNIGKIIIKTSGTEVFGIYGCGRERYGILNVLKGEDNLMTKLQITTVMKDQIVVAGAFVHKEAIQKAVGFGIGAIIAGGFGASDFISIVGSLDWNKRVGVEVGVSLLATEGFGPIPIGVDIYPHFQTHQGKYVFINGNSASMLLPSLESDSIISLRKIALPGKGLIEHFQEVLVRSIEVEDKVRIVGSSFTGAQGKVISIDKTATVLPSGVSTYILTVETLRQKIRVPYPNVEIIP